MFILTADQINPQQALRRHHSQVEKLVAIAYQQWLFIQGESYSAEEREVAIKQTREKLDSGQMCILVIDQRKQKYVVCYQDPQLEALEEKASAVTINENSAALVDAIRQASGLIKNNRHKLRVYPKSIIGSELVNWLCDYLKCSRKDAVKVGQSLIEQGWLHHTGDKHEFKDEGLLYRFYQDERLSLPFVTG